MRYIVRMQVEKPLYFEKKKLRWGWLSKSDGYPGVYGCFTIEDKDDAPHDVVIFKTREAAAREAHKGKLFYCTNKVIIPRVAVVEELPANWGKTAEEITIDTLTATNKSLEADNDEWQLSFDLTQSRLEEATKAWQESTGRHDCSPDLGALLHWMLESKHKLEAANQGLVEALEKIRDVGADYCQKANDGGSNAIKSVAAGVAVMSSIARAALQANQ